MSYVPDLVALYEIEPYILLALDNNTFIFAVTSYLKGGKEKDDIIKKYGHINNWNVSKVDYELKVKIPLEDDTIHAAVNDYLEGDELKKKAVIIKYGKIEYWNVSKVTDMSYLFQNRTEFNENIGASGTRKGWNVSNVTDMSYMFDGATCFNQPIGAWNVENVTNMSHMFHNARNFNQFRASNCWCTRNVTNMSHMFDGATSFGIRQVGMRDGLETFESVFAKISDWNVENVTNMSHMFHNAVNFNGMIGGWDTSNVTNMTGMFDGASRFKKTLYYNEKTWYHT